MARTREFDPEEALDKAVQLFWQKGYFDTSMDDLVKETGVSRYGLYGTFGNKQALFDAALMRYAMGLVTSLQEELRRPDAGRAEIERFFEKLLDMAAERKGHLGCMICNTAVELAPHDKEMQTRVQTLFANMKETLRNAIANGQKAGDITADVDATELALTLTAVLQGLAVFSRSGMSPDGMRSTVQTALRILD